jgi:hypothetical protein
VGRDGWVSQGFPTQVRYELEGSVPDDGIERVLAQLDKLLGSGNGADVNTTFTEGKVTIKVRWKFPFQIRITITF